MTVAELPLYCELTGFDVRTIGEAAFGPSWQEKLVQSFHQQGVQVSGDITSSRISNWIKRDTKKIPNEILVLSNKTIMDRLEQVNRAIHNTEHQDYKLTIATFEEAGKAIYGNIWKAQVAHLLNKPRQRIFDIYDRRISLNQDEVLPALKKALHERKAALESVIEKYRFV